MPALGDYLGLLLSEISIARMQADLETIRLAEFYATHPLLRTMAVPRMRLPSVDLDLPVLIAQSEDPRVGESARGGAAIEAMRQKFDEIFAAHLAKAEVKLSDAARGRLRALLDERIRAHGLPTETSVDVGRVADDLTSAALGFLGEIKRPKDAPKPAISPAQATDLRAEVRVEFIRLRSSPPRLTVLVTTAELREAGSAENITRLRLKVTEDSMEWTTIESEGVSRDRLVPE